MLKNFSLVAFFYFCCFISIELVTMPDLHWSVSITVSLLLLVLNSAILEVKHCTEANDMYQRAYDQCLTENYFAKKWAVNVQDPRTDLQPFLVSVFWEDKISGEGWGLPTQIMALNKFDAELKASKMATALDAKVRVINF